MNNSFYFDKESKYLKNFQSIKLDVECSSIWIFIDSLEKNDVYKNIISLFNNYIGYFWHISSGGYGTKKVLDFKRAFGSSVKKEDICLFSDLYILDSKFYSDVVHITEQNEIALSKLIMRNLFGIDSNIFFMPIEIRSSLLKTIVNPLEKLFIKRNSALIIDNFLNDFFLEDHITNIITLDGIATLKFKDSNMSTILVFIGNNSVINLIVNVQRNGGFNEAFNEINNTGFLERLNVGLSIGSLS